MIGQIVNVGVGFEEFSAVIQIDANSERTGLGGLVHGNPRQQFSTDFDEGILAGRGLFDVAKVSCELAHEIEIGCTSWHGTSARDSLYNLGLLANAVSGERSAFCASQGKGGESC